jgi:hypothetical protein
VSRDKLIVVLPGIGGTVLAVPDGGGRPTQVAWGGRLADVGLLRHPERLSVDERPRLVPVGLVPSQTAFGLWTVVPGYDRLLARLAQRDGAVLDDGTPPGRNMDANVVAFGYDFRLGVADAAQALNTELRQRLAWRWPEERDRKARIVFVAHSMGGLVARYWAAVLGGAPWCRGMITLGTPHRGAPKALEVLANGLPVGRFHLTRPVEVVRQWQGMADLLPRYPAVEDRRAEAEFGNLARSSGGIRSKEPQSLLRPHEVPLSWLAGPARRAHAMHQAIERGWRGLDTPPAVFPRIGFGHATLRSCSWDGTGVRVTRDAPAGPELGGWGADVGDGTVPMFCGLPVEMDHYPRTNLRVHRRHGPIAELEEIESLLDAFQADASLSAYRAADEGQVSLGLDLEELQLRGRPVPLAATPVTAGGHLVEPGPSTVWASARPLRDAGGDGTMGAIVDVRLEWDEQWHAFRGEFPGLAPGLVDVTVTAQTLTDHPATQVVEVLEDADLE